MSNSVRSNRHSGGRITASLSTRRILWVIVGAALLLRIVGLGSRPLWLDEAYSLRNALAPLSALWSWSGPIEPADPPLYFTLLHWWLGFGDSVVALRSLSVVFGVGLIPVVYGLGKRLFDTGTGLLAAALAAVSPALIRFGQEARMYPLLALELVVALWGVAALLVPQTWIRPSNPAPEQRPESRDRLRAFSSRFSFTGWSAYVLGTGLALLTHHTAAFFLIAVNIVVLTMVAIRKTGTGFAKRWAGAQIAVLAIWAIWLPGLVTQIRWFQDAGQSLFPSLTVRRVLFTAYDLYVPFTWVAAPDRSHLVEAFALVSLGTVVVLVAAALASRRQAPLMLVAGAPALVWLLVIIASLRSPILVIRVVVWTAVPLFLLLAAGFFSIRDRRFRAWMGIALVVTIGTSLFSYETTFRNAAWNDSADYIACNSTDGDTVLFFYGDGYLPFSYYLPSKPALRLVPVSVKDAANLEPLPEGLHHAWLVYSHADLLDPGMRVPEAIAKFGTLKSVKNFEQITVYEYDLVGTKPSALGDKPKQSTQPYSAGVRGRFLNTKAQQ